MVKVNRCTSSLKPASSCAITLSFSIRALFSGPFSANVIVNAGSNHLSIPVIATINGRPESPSSSEPSLSFSLAGFNSGSGAQRNLVVTNAGPGNASSIIVTPPVGYGIWINRCVSTLRAHQSCTVTLYYKNSRSSSPAPSGTVQLAASSQSGSISIPSLDVLTGLVGGSSGGGGGSISINLERPTGNEIIMLYNSGSPDSKVYCGAEGWGMDTCVYIGDQYNRTLDMTNGTMQLYYVNLTAEAQDISVTSTDPDAMLNVSSQRNDFNGQVSYVLTISGLTKDQTLMFSYTESTGGDFCMNNPTDPMCDTGGGDFCMNNPTDPTCPGNSGNTCTTGYYSGLTSTCYNDGVQLAYGECSWNARYWDSVGMMCYDSTDAYNLAQCISTNPSNHWTGSACQSDVDYRHDNCTGSQYWDQIDNVCYIDKATYTQNQCSGNPQFSPECYGYSPTFRDSNDGSHVSTYGGVTYFEAQVDVFDINAFEGAWLYDGWGCNQVITNENVQTPVSLANTGMGNEHLVSISGQYPFPIAVNSQVSMRVISTYNGGSDCKNFIVDDYAH